MKLIAKLSIALIWCFAIYGQVASVTLKKGIAYKISDSQQIDLTLNDTVNTSETIITGEKSVLKLKFNDESQITLGSNSSFVVSEFIQTDKSRNITFNLLTGKLRAEVTKTPLEQNQVKVITRKVSVGVRGTEFLVNSFPDKSDIALLEGKVDANFNNKLLELKPGQYLSTIDGEIKTIPKEALEKLINNKEDFLPDLESFTIKPEPELSSSLPSAATGLAVGASLGLALESNKIAKDDNEENEESNDPDDIKYAKKNREQLLKKNQCFYWIYKSLPGNAKLERFRRERKCDDYYFDM